MQGGLCTRGGVFAGHYGNKCVCANCTQGWAINKFANQKFANSIQKNSQFAIIRFLQLKPVLRYIAVLYHASLIISSLFSQVLDQKPQVTELLEKFSSNKSTNSFFSSSASQKSRSQQAANSRLIFSAFCTFPWRLLKCSKTSNIHVFPYVLYLLSILTWNSV